mmetsp:Transcript_59288/g.136904  ORF Transcript_59288/g.136904 Transcript_59288/m.136904 type:complete len:207 (+) Transcript_59288:647-1267(+)
MGYRIGNAELVDYSILLHGDGPHTYMASRLRPPAAHGRLRLPQVLQSPQLLSHLEIPVGIIICVHLVLRGVARGTHAPRSINAVFAEPGRRLPAAFERPAAGRALPFFLCGAGANVALAAMDLQAYHGSPHRDHRHIRRRPGLPHTKPRHRHRVPAHPQPPATRATELIQEPRDLADEAASGPQGQIFAVGHFHVAHYGGVLFGVS